MCLTQEQIGEKQERLSADGWLSCDQGRGSCM